MSRISMIWFSLFESDFANGYDEYGRSLGPERWTSPNAAGSMLTTPRDYARFLGALMRDEVLSSAARERMLSPQIRIHSAHQFPSLNTDTTTAYDPIELSYGIGWGLYKAPYGPAFFKEGHDEGWRNLALCFLNGDGMLVMTNSSNGEGIFRPRVEDLLGETAFPFGWDGYTPLRQAPSAAEAEGAQARVSDGRPTQAPRRQIRARRRYHPHRDRRERPPLHPRE
jgi:CubicO group peptidase (beta-lactamase class C family)